MHADAPAKINLGLHVLRRRADGFHDVETVLVPIGWADGLTARPAPGLRFTCSDPALPTDDGNLVVRAARALAGWAGVAPAAALHLAKRVPYGAGLGSGSSDAAHTLRLLARLWGLDVPADALHGLAAGLGSDVPFFLGDGPALATGRGEVLTPLR
ncbi:MAG: 4-(cytidine 5'-diphospho)-2-C-methyl-D-erythritol kinase, partial [Rubricoccaceae bacterium]|nr:4-(cytidine 5'-diphospho)-2-C-methyl-D-erythritol kinase [Rubricoccaceae bacterium]